MRTADFGPASNHWHQSGSSTIIFAGLKNLLALAAQIEESKKVRYNSVVS
jgi:hypothetical protein